MTSYAVGGFFAALAGVATTAYTGGGAATPSVANVATLSSVAAIVLGGVALTGGVGGFFARSSRCGACSSSPATCSSSGSTPRGARPCAASSSCSSSSSGRCCGPGGHAHDDSHHSGEGRDPPRLAARTGHRRPRRRARRALRPQRGRRHRLPHPGPAAQHPPHRRAPGAVRRRADPVHAHGRHRPLGDDDGDGDGLRRRVPRRGRRLDPHVHAARLRHGARHRRRQRRRHRRLQGQPAHHDAGDERHRPRRPHRREPELPRRGHAHADLGDLGGGTVLGPLPWNLLVLLAIGTALVLCYDAPVSAGSCTRRETTGSPRGWPGVRVWRVELAVYVTCALLAGVAGILVGGRSGAVDLQLANSDLLPSVAAAVIGGTSILGGVGGMGGTFLGALILTAPTRSSSGCRWRSRCGRCCSASSCWPSPGPDVTISRTRGKPR